MNKPATTRFARVLICLFLFVSTSPAISQTEAAVAGDQDDTLRVLFVGNSYTAYFNLPAQVQAMCDHAGIDAKIEMTTAGGKSWRWHFEEGKAPGRIAEGGWDFVVLQDFSRGALDKPEEFDEFGEKMIGLIEDVGAKPVLYLTWARQHLPEDQATLTGMYASLAQRTGAAVAPVGVAWRHWFDKVPDAPLHRSDRSHPNRAGTYLAACVFYATLTGQSPVGQVHHIAGRDVVEKTDTLVNLPEAEARMLQECAAESVRRFDIVKVAEQFEAQRGVTP